MIFYDGVVHETYFIFAEHKNGEQHDIEWCPPCIPTDECIPGHCMGIPNNTSTGQQQGASTTKQTTI